MKNQLLMNYLDLKGFKPEDLYANHAVIMDDDKFMLSDSGESWVDKEVAYNEETHKVVTARDILIAKSQQYLMDNCTAAIFVPLFNLNGDFTGLSIRKMCDKKHDSWFVPGSRKIDLVYNLNESFNQAVRKNSIILTEGVYDTIALKKYGITHAGALLGTNMSNLQFFQLFSVVDNIALCLDNDEAGHKAIATIVNNYGKYATFWKVDIDRDPDEFLKLNGPDVFRQRISKINDK